MAPIPQIPPDSPLVVGLDMFKTTLEIYDTLREYAEGAGFSIYKIRSLRLDDNKVPGRIDVGCDRGKARPSRATVRNSTTKKIGCPWTAKILKTAKEGLSFDLTGADHNHDQAEQRQQPQAGTNLPALYHQPQSLALDSQESVPCSVMPGGGSNELAPPPPPPPPLPNNNNNAGHAEDDADMAQQQQSVFGFAGIFDESLYGLAPEARVREFMRRTVEAERVLENDWTSLILPHLRVLSTGLPNAVSARSTSPPLPTVTFLLAVQPVHCSRLGTLHGGCAATLLDFCTTVALHLVSRPGAWRFLGVSRTLAVTYLRPVASGDRVHVRCEVLQAGHRLAALRGTIVRPADGALMVTCEHTKVNTDPAVAGRI